MSTWRTRVDYHRADIWIVVHDATGRTVYTTVGPDEAAMMRDALADRWPELPACDFALAEDAVHETIRKVQDAVQDAEDRYCPRCDARPGESCLSDPHPTDDLYEVPPHAERMQPKAVAS